MSEGGTLRQTLEAGVKVAAAAGEKLTKGRKATGRLRLSLDSSATIRAT